MTFFLFAKQIVDMLYQYRILDYIMVLLVLLLLVYQAALVRPDIRKHFTAADGIVLLLSLLLTISFLKTMTGYQIYFKVLSAFLIYFVGRIYYDRIKECYGALVSAAYIVIYLNFFTRIYRYGFTFIQVENAGGDLYYYDTDMAFAMILAMLLITMFGKNSLFKIVTSFVICPYMVFFSDAGIQKILMLAVYIIMIIYFMELVLSNRKLPGILLIVMLLGLIGSVIVIYLPVMGFDNVELILGLFNGKLLDNSNMYTRYIDWQKIMEICVSQGIITRLLGIGMGSEVSIQSLYIKILYAAGYAGLLLSVLLIISVMYYVVKVDDRKVFYLTVTMAVLLLGSGVTVNSMETTQMSWFPFLFAGMVISSVQVEEDAKTESDDRVFPI